MNWPNAISLIRILLIPLFIYAILQGNYLEASVVFLLAAVSDALDGLVARLTRTQSRLGTILDPLADKLLLTAAYVVLGVKGVLPLWLTVAVISRDVIIVLGAITLHLLKGHLEVRPLAVSKANTFFQLLTVCLALFAGVTSGDGLIHAWVATALEPAILLTLTLTVLSGIIYILTGLRLLEEESPS